MKRSVVLALLPALLLSSVTPAAAETQAGPELLFGMGPTADAGLDSNLVRDAPVNMLTTWFNGSEDLAWLGFWKDTLIKDAYDDGYAHHLVVYSEGLEQSGVSTEYGSACGQPYPVSDQFVTDMERLAEIFVGDGPLYVTFFSEFQTYVCNDSQWVGNENYFRALKDNFRAGAEVFQAKAGDDVFVSFGPWGGWQHQYDDPSVGGGRSLIPYFADVMRESDFQSFQAMDSDLGSNPEIMLEMTKLLAPFGPVMMAHYLPDDESTAVWDADIEQIFTDAAVTRLTEEGLFAFSFMDPFLLDDPARSDRTARAVSEYAADWLVPPALRAGSPPPAVTPPVEEPPVVTPPVEDPPVVTPPVEEPPVEEPPADTEPEKRPHPRDQVSKKPHPRWDRYLAGGGGGSWPWAGRVAVEREPR
jgi:hypothetical protein